MNRETLVIRLDNLEEVDMLFETCKELEHTLEYIDYEIEYEKFDDKTVKTYNVKVKCNYIHGAYTLGRIYQMKRDSKLYGE
jgi:hypothetical protein